MGKFSCLRPAPFTVGDMGFIRFKNSFKCLQDVAIMRCNLRLAFRVVLNPFYCGKYKLLCQARCDI